MPTNKPKTHETHFGIRMLKSAHPDIKKLKRQYPTSIHGNKLWKSSYLLMDHFKKNPPTSKQKVMEVGCGWGLASIFINRQYQCPVTAIDADRDVFPYLQLHAVTNKASVTTLRKRFEQIRKKDLAEVDILIAADVCFWDELADIHRKLISRAIQAGVSKIVYADPMRSPFLELARHCEEKYCADMQEVKLAKANKARGALLIIENA